MMARGEAPKALYVLFSDRYAVDQTA